jgi:hypothetical protein
MEKIPKSMVEKAIKQIDEIHEKVSKIETNQIEIEWFDIPETCRFLKISSRTLQNYRNNGLLPFSQVNSKIYFRKQDLLKFLEGHLVNNSKF